MNIFSKINLYKLYLYNIFIGIKYYLKKTIYLTNSTKLKINIKIFFEFIQKTKIDKINLYTMNDVNIY